MSGPMNGEAYRLTSGQLDPSGLVSMFDHMVTGFSEPADRDRFWRREETARFSNGHY